MSLKLLKFPEKDIYRERISSALSALACPEKEYLALMEIFEALIDFYDTLDAPEAEILTIELTKMMLLSNHLYDSWLDEN